MTETQALDKFSLTKLMAEPLAQQLQIFLRNWHPDNGWPERESLSEFMQLRFERIYGSRLDLNFGTPIYLGKRRRQKLKKAGQEVYKLARREALYETQIFERRLIPHRTKNWHDFMNAAIWTLFPLSKLELHRQAFWQQQRLTEFPEANGRSEELDQLTCFDEGGLLLLVEVEQLEASHQILGQRDLAAKVQWLRHNNQWELVIFGHGIWEGLQCGMQAVQAMTLIIPSNISKAPGQIAWTDARLQAIDCALAEHLASTFASEAAGKPCQSRRFASLPVQELRSVIMEKTGQTAEASSLMNPYCLRRNRIR